MEKVKFEYELQVARKRARDYYYANREKCIEYSKRYYREHKAEIRQKTKEGRKRQRIEKNI